MTKQLSSHFSEAEFIRSQSAERNNIDNSFIKPEHKENAIRLCLEYLEPVREYAVQDSPLIINSGYRVPELNKNIGGSPNSMHMEGLAADIRSNYYPMEGVLKAIIFYTKKGILPLFDQMYLSKYGFIHYGITAKGDESRGLVLDSEGVKVLEVVKLEEKVVNA